MSYVFRPQVTIKAMVASTFPGRFLRQETFVAVGVVLLYNDLQGRTRDIDTKSFVGVIMVMKWIRHDVILRRTQVTGLGNGSNGTSTGGTNGVGVATFGTVGGRLCLLQQVGKLGTRGIEAHGSVTHNVPEEHVG